MTRSVFPIVAISTLILTAAPGGYANVASFQGLGLSEASDVSADGSVVVGNAGSQAYRWTATEGIQPIGSASTVTQIRASGISGDGNVVVGESEGIPFRWTQDDGVTHIPGVAGGWAHATSFDGSVVVGWGDGDIAFRWSTSSGLQLLDNLPSNTTFPIAHDVSDDGSIVVGWGGGVVGQEAIRWTADGSAQGLGGANGSFAFGVSGDGTVVVGGRYTDWIEPFRWTADDGMIGLGQLPGGNTYSEAADVSDNGSVIVGNVYSNSPGGENGAFLWNAIDGMHSLQDILTIDLGLDLTGWQLTGATGISADGLTIVGNGIGPNGFNQGWIATLPEPGTLAVLALGVPMLLRRRTH